MSNPNYCEVFGVPSTILHIAAVQFITIDFAFGP